MEKLLTKQTLCPDISKEEFQSDLDCLFEVLRTNKISYNVSGADLRPPPKFVIMILLILSCEGGLRHARYFGRRTRL